MTSAKQIDNRAGCSTICLNLPVLVCRGTAIFSYWPAPWNIPYSTSTHRLHLPYWSPTQLAHWSPLSSTNDLSWACKTHYNLFSPCESPWRVNRLLQTPCLELDLTHFISKDDTCWSCLESCYKCLRTFLAWADRKILHPEKGLFSELEKEGIFIFWRRIFFRGKRWLEEDIWSIIEVGNELVFLGMVLRSFIIKL